MKLKMVLTHKSLFVLFSMTSALLVLSRLLVLRSNGRPLSFDLSILPNSKLLAMAENEHHNKSPLISASKGEKKETKNDISRKSDSSRQVLKVFMYDLPSEFHFSLLGWKRKRKSVWPNIRAGVPEYPGGLNLQHSIEYWLTLDLLNSEFADNLGCRSAIRVHNSSQADVVFVPFFSSISYNRYSKLKPGQKSINNFLQEKLVQFLMEQEEWKRYGGKDHIIVAHHPNSLLDARTKLWPAMFILADFGRYPPTVANVDKDVIAPYRHMIRSYVNDSSGFDSRPTLLYFQGAIYRKDGGMIRQELFYMLQNEKDVHFSFGSAQKNGVDEASQGMHSSKFCLNIAGDTPSSNRLFDAIASHCVPVVISDEIELPYEDVLNYSEFCVFVRTSDALKENFLLNLIKNISREEWTRMWKRLKEVERFFEFRYPSQDQDAVQMIWQAFLRKVPAVKREIHKSKRFTRTTLPAEGLMSFHVPIFFRNS